MRASVTAAAGLLLLANIVLAIDVDASDSQSVIDAAGTIAASVMSKYNGNKGDGNIPGLFPDQYYWWESGLAWDSLIYYAALTGDDQYNDAISQAMTFQVGPNNNYMLPNQSRSLGNDDQSYWALAAMTAEETSFPPPELDDVDSWLQLAQNVFDSQVTRWDNESCGGGLRWQIYSFNAGYTYKNTQSNGNFMQLAARLYANTQNETYAEWFNTAAQWLTEVGLYNNETGSVYDGTSVEGQCKQLNHIEWTANSGTLLISYANMISSNNNGASFSEPISKILGRVQKAFVKNNILTETACLPNDTCNVDQLAFRAVLARALASSQGLSSGGTNGSVSDILAASAEAAGSQCSGGSDGTTCGSDWTASGYDGSKGLGEDLSALNIMLANLPQKFEGSSASNGTLNSTSSGSSGFGGSGTSSGGASGTSSSPNASSSAEVQDQNFGEQRAASMFGLLGALGFAVAFFL